MDSFAKRLAACRIPSPGDISERDRWAVGGTFRPTNVAQAALEITLGALAASFVGTHTGPVASDYDIADRFRLERIPYPGGIGVQNRYAIGGSWLYIDAGDAGGAVEATLGALTADFSGTVDNPEPDFGQSDRWRLERIPVPGDVATRNRFAIGGSFLIEGTEGDVDGDIVATLGGLTASFLGGASYEYIYDVSWALTPAFTMTVLPKRDGALDATLGGLDASFVGTALPPDSVSGRITAALGALAADFAGTFTAPPARAGRVHADLAQLVASVRGSAVPPGGSTGQISATLGGLDTSFAGTFSNWTTDGAADLSLGALTSTFRGMFIEAGANVALLDANLGGLQASFRGSVGDPPQHQRVKPARTAKPTGKGREAKVTRKDREYNA